MIDDLPSRFLYLEARWYAWAAAEHRRQGIDFRTAEYEAEAINYQTAAAVAWQREQDS